MNKKAEVFQKYLEEKDIKVFQVQEVPEDELNTVVFRSNITAEGQQLPTLILLDDSIYGIVRVRVANNALKDSNEAELVKTINELNAKYKVFKYYIADDGALIMDSVILNKPGEVDGDMIYTVLDVVVRHLNEDYKKIMKLIWA